MKQKKLFVVKKYIMAKDIAEVLRVETSPPSLAAIRLFNRFRFAHKIALTDAGRRAYLYAARLLALADEARLAVQPSSKKSANRP